MLGKIKQTLKVFRITVNVRYWYNEIIYVSKLFYERLFLRFRVKTKNADIAMNATAAIMD